MVKETIDDIIDRVAEFKRKSRGVEHSVPRGDSLGS